MRMMFATGFVIALVSPAIADEAKTMDAVDLAIDGDALNGQTVTATGCKFAGMSTDAATCNSTTNFGVTIWIDGKSLDREQLRKLLKECPMMNSNPACTGSITGVVGRSMMGDVELSNANIEWAK